MRKPFMAGNWKMNMDVNEARELAEGLKAALAGIDDVDVAVFPPMLSVATVVDALKGSSVAVGPQNLHWEPKGAYTGEIAAGMVKAAGCTRVIIGHSERRQYFGETDETVNKKLKAALDAGLLPIVCIGETLDQRKSGVTMDIVGGQVKGALAGITVEQMKSVTLAYEPIWAIGTGETATPEQAEEVHAGIRALVAELFDDGTAQGVRIQYGGSMKPENVADLMACENIDGGLIGGAALKVDSFTKIAKLGR